MSDRSLVEYTTEGGVAVITLNRPNKLNALNRAMYRSVNEAVERYNADATLRAAVITATGRSFCAGVDLGDVRAALADAGSSDLNALAEQFSLDIEARPFPDKPIIVAMHGQCYGNGFTLALACDLRIASSDAVFCLPEVKIGLASVDGTWRAVQMAGMGTALELLLLGEPRDAEWVHRAGLVNIIVERDEVMDKAMEWAHTIASMDPAAIRATREVASFSRFNGFDDIVALGASLRSLLEAR